MIASIFKAIWAAITTFFHHQATQKIDEEQKQISQQLEEKREEKKQEVESRSDEQAQKDINKWFRD
jgi:DNA-binding transcriptional regulator GbsR (MarR family)